MTNKFIKTVFNNRVIANTLNFYVVSYIKVLTTYNWQIINHAL